MVCTWEFEFRTRCLHAQVFVHEMQVAEKNWHNSVNSAPSVNNPAASTAQHSPNVTWRFIASKHIISRVSSSWTTLILWFSFLPVSQIWFVSRQSVNLRFSVLSSAAHASLAIKICIFKLYRCRCKDGTAEVFSCYPDVLLFGVFCGAFCRIPCAVEATELKEYYTVRFRSVARRNGRYMMLCLILLFESQRSYPQL
jgi:hypothetical protein